MSEERPRLDESQQTLLYGVVTSTAPELRPIAERVVAGATITDEEAGQLSDALVDAMLADSGPDGQLSTIGVAIDGIIGKVWILSEGFFLNREDEGSSQSV